MNDEHDLIDSPLNQTYTANGRSVEIHIYRMPNTGWTPMATPNCSTYGRSNCSRQDGRIMTMWV